MRRELAQRLQPRRQLGLLVFRPLPRCVRLVDLLRFSGYQVKLLEPLTLQLPWSSGQLKELW